jgi:hypothetical protein
MPLLVASVLLVFEASWGIKMNRRFQTRKSCRLCGRKVAAVADANNPNKPFKLSCAHCDNPDPLKSVIAQRWADAPLKPPTG